MKNTDKDKEEARALIMQIVGFAVGWLLRCWKKGASGKESNE